MYWYKFDYIVLSEGEEVATGHFDESFTAQQTRAQLKEKVMARLQPCIQVLPQVHLLIRQFEEVLAPDAPFET
jgi:hypothetical protein